MISEEKKIVFQSMSISELEETIMNICEYPNNHTQEVVTHYVITKEALEIIEYLLTSEELEETVNIHFNEDFLFKTIYSQIKEHPHSINKSIILILGNKKIEEKDKIDFRDNYFKKAIKESQFQYDNLLELLKSLEENQTIIDIIISNILPDNILEKMCLSKNDETIKYLLLSPYWQTNINIHKNNDYVLRRFMLDGNLEMVKFLLTSLAIKEHANIHANKESGFKVICERYKQYENYKVLNKSSKELLDYLIFEYKIPYSQEIQEFIVREKINSIIEMFNKREFNHQLKKELIKNKTNKTPRSKI